MMIKKLIAWLKAIYSKNEDQTMTTEATTATAEPATAPADPVVSNSVSDFDKALAFVEHGLEVFGTAAKDDLVALVKKFA